MALLFTTPLPLETGLTLTNAYGRVSAVDNYKGTNLGGFVDVFVSEDAYLQGASPVRVPFTQGVDVPYDRATDGVDVLDLAHDALIEALKGQNIEATKSL